MKILMLKEIELLMLAGNPSKRYTATIEIEGTKITNVKVLKEVDNAGEITFEAIPIDCFTAWLKFESNSEGHYPNERNFASVDSFIKYSHKGRKIAETENNVVPRTQSDAAEGNATELSESEIARIEAEAAKYEQIPKGFVYFIKADEAKHEITITLPAGQNQLVLPEDWIYTFINQLINQTHKWRQKSRYIMKEYDKSMMLSSLKGKLIKALKGEPPFEKNREAAINAIVDRIYQICDKEE